MTNAELQKRVEFIIEQQAQLGVNQGKAAEPEEPGGRGM